MLYDRSMTVLLSSHFLAHVVEIKKGFGSTAHWSIPFIRLNGWLRHSFTLLITALDIDQVGPNWEDSNKTNHSWPIRINRTANAFAAVVDAHRKSDPLDRSDDG